MKKISKKVHHKDGSVSRCPEDIYRLLNLSVLHYTNMTHSAEGTDMPVVPCDTHFIPDFLALYSEPGLYHKTPLTAVCFYEYDYLFDDIDGIYNAIYYNKKDLLDRYRERFKDVRIFISPDYSEFGDLHKPENEYRLWKARIVSLWIINDLKAILIPSITYVSRETFPFYFSGLEDCSVVAFSTKGHIRNKEDRALLVAAVKYAVDHLPLSTIVVYSVCGHDETSLELFRYAKEKGVDVIIPNNSLRERNMGRCSHE
ncbi:MAG: DUF4417 domain-containing protein [Clostridia bacterium]|nr:DUF4417 domain-containing protein [Clostridia bacterium]